MGRCLCIIPEQDQDKSIISFEVVSSQVTNVVLEKDSRVWRLETVSIHEIGDLLASLKSRRALAGK